MIKKDKNVSFIKKVIIIVFMLILTSGISIYATATYMAENVWYTKSDNNVINVGQALNELYSNQKDIESLETQLNTAQNQLNTTQNQLGTTQSQLDTLNSNINQTNAIASDILSGKKAYTTNGLITGNIVNRGQLNWNPTTYDTYNVPAGYYSGGTISNCGV